MAFFNATSVRSLPDAGPAYNCRRRWRLSALAHERSGRARPSRFLVKAGLCPVRECRSSTGSCGRSRSVKFDAAGLRERTTWLTRRPQARDRRVVGNALDAATARETKRSLPRRLSNENFTQLWSFYPILLDTKNAAIKRSQTFKTKIKLTNLLILPCIHL